MVLEDCAALHSLSPNGTSQMICQTKKNSCHGMGGSIVPAGLSSYLVELPQVLLLLLVHHNVDPGNGFADHTDLGELGGGPAGDLGHPQKAQLMLESIQLLGQFLLLLGTELGALDFNLKQKDNVEILRSFRIFSSMCSKINITGKRRQPKSKRT